MHEFSIVQNIIDTVIDSAKSNGVTKVHCVEIEVGQASGVIREALEFAWEAAIEGTLLKGATLKIIEKPLTVKCLSCGHRYDPCSIYDSCPGCGDVHPEILSGNELKVIAIDV